MSKDKDQIPEGSVEQMRYLLDQTAKLLHPEPQEITEVYVQEQPQIYRLREGKRISGRFDQNIIIDPANYGAGQRHAHILGRKGIEIGIVNIDGTASHGTKCRLHKDDILALRAQGFHIPDNGIIEWVSLGASGPFLLCD